jgi:hypothetical protein
MALIPVLVNCRSLDHREQAPGDERSMENFAGVLVELFSGGFSSVPVEMLKSQNLGLTTDPNDELTQSGEHPSMGCSEGGSNDGS